MKNWSRTKKTVVAVGVIFLGLIGIGSVSSPQKTVNNQNQSAGSSSNQSPAQVQGANTAAPAASVPAQQTPTATEPATSPAGDTQSAQSSNCDPNYSGGCVPIASDVDCGGGSGNGPAYFYGTARVVGTDIYGLDRDGDGIACE